LKILYIGADLSVNGGIATVLKSYYASYCRGNYPFDFLMVKTTNYQHGFLLGNMLLFVKALFKVLFLLLFSPDICIVHVKSSAFRSFQRKFWMVFCAHCFHKKVIFHLHSGKFQKMYESGKPLILWQLRKVFQWSDQVVALSQNLEQLTKEHFPEIATKLILIPNPVALPVDYPVCHQKEDDKYHILFLGYLQELKGIRTLLTIEQQTRKTHSDWVFEIAGKGELQPMVERSAAESVGRIHFYGWADAALREKLYRQCDVFILPSYVEGMPLGVLEAMSYGLPIVSTPAGGIPDIVGTNHFTGVLTAPGDAVGFVRALEHFYHADQQTCRDSVNQRIKLFGEDLIYQQVLDVYAKLSPELEMEIKRNSLLQK